MRRAGSPLAALSLKLDWSSFHSRPFLGLVGSRGVLGVVELGGGATKPTPHLWEHQLKNVDVLHVSSSCIVEAMQNGIAGVVAVPTALPETQEIAVLERRFADVSHVTAVDGSEPENLVS